MSVKVKKDRAAVALKIGPMAAKTQVANRLKLDDQIRISEVKALHLSSLQEEQGNAPWEMFAHQLLDYISATTPEELEGLQIVSTPMLADWDDPKFGRYRMNYMIADRIPRWGSSYFATNERVSDGYRIFIDNIDLPQPNKEEYDKARKAKDDYFTALDALETAQGKVGERWKDFDDRQQSVPESNRLTFDEWFEEFDGRRIGMLQDDLDIYAQEYSAFFNNAMSGMGWAASVVDDFKNKASTEFLTTPGDRKVQCRSYEVLPDLAKWINESKATIDAAPALRIVMNKSSYRRHTENTKLGGGGFFWGGFWGVKVGGQYQKYSNDVSSESFGLTFTAQNIANFDIAPGNWFHQTACKALKDGPFVENGPIKRGFTKLWGRDGVLSLVPTTLIVAYRPAVTGTLSEADYSYVKASYQAGGSIQIGPFGFGADYSKTTEDVKFDDSTRSFTARSNTDRPQVIAVINTVMPG